MNAYALSLLLALNTSPVTISVSNEGYQVANIRFNGRPKTAFVSMDRIDQGEKTRIKTDGGKDEIIYGERKPAYKFLEPGRYDIPTLPEFYAIMRAVADVQDTTDAEQRELARRVIREIKEDLRRGVIVGSGVTYSGDGKPDIAKHRATEHSGRLSGYERLFVTTDETREAARMLFEDTPVNIRNTFESIGLHPQIFKMTREDVKLKGVVVLNSDGSNLYIQTLADENFSETCGRNIRLADQSSK